MNLVWSSTENSAFITKNPSDLKRVANFSGTTAHKSEMVQLA